MKCNVSSFLSSILNINRTMLISKIKLFGLIALGYSLISLGQAQAATRPSDTSKVIAQSTIASNSTTSFLPSGKLKQQSELTPEQSRKMRSRSPYGYAIITYWINGDRFLKQEQFDSAIAQFRKAADASKVLKRTDIPAAQNLRLKQCAIAGSEARLQGAIAARDFYKKNNRRQSAGDEAFVVYQRVFNASYEQAEAKNPQVASGCP